ncbi:hypothetical protein RF11_11223 [Thelohanellus kitauei]|uniref:Structure-specific endonuclease subunit SLX1 C-terminal domain-containing protein n=1 Tax=Thelohanellus kitauei TaxID=669202 RepID=A0A0C2JDF1_THEKT|nr:hypothetical protein RF11_11223 [Thelohanellus kitauei]
MKNQIGIGSFESIRGYYESRRLASDKTCRKCLESFSRSDKRIMCINETCPKIYHLKCAYEISKECPQNETHLMIPMYLQCLECGNLNNWNHSIILSNRID